MASSDAGEQIKVAVRVRKLLNREDKSNISWQVDSENTISALDGSKK